MKKNIIFFITLLSTLSACSGNTNNESEPVSSEESTISSQTKDSSSAISADHGNDEIGCLITRIEYPNQVSLDEEIKLNVKIGHFWSGKEDLSYMSDDYENFSYKLAFYYGKSTLAWDLGKDFSFEIVADLPDFNTEKYDIQNMASPDRSSFIFRQSMEITMDKNIFQLTDEECGYLFFSIKIFDSQNVEIKASLLGYEDMEIYYIKEENNIEFNYLWRPFIKTDD